MISNRTKVVFWNNQPAPYVVSWFNAIVRHDRFDFEAWFDVDREPDRHWDVDPHAWNFKYRWVPPAQFPLRRFQIPADLLRQAQPDLFVQNLDTIDHGLGACVARRFSRRLALAIEPPSAIRRKPYRLRELSKHLLIRGVDGAAVSGPESAEWLVQHGLPAERTWWTHEGVDVKHFGRFRYMPERDRDALRSTLGLPKGIVFVYAGRFISRKGIPILLEAFSRLVRWRSDISLFLIGSGSDEQSLRQLAEPIPNVVFAGERQLSELPKLYAASDILVFPTLADNHGMVVEEAMAAGLPVISTTAAGNITYRVRPGQNGFLVQPGSVDELAAAMTSYADMTEADRRELSAGAAAFADSVSPDIYADEFVTFAEDLLCRQSRQGLAARVMRLTGTMIAAASDLSTPHLA